MRKFKNNFYKLTFFIPWIILACALWLHHSNFAPVEILRLKTFDAYQNISPRETFSNNVFIVDIDEKSLDEIGQWPWSRVVIAKLIQKLFDDYSIKVLGFDMVFAEKDRTSPDIIASVFKENTVLQNELLKLPSNETIFNETIKKYPVVMGHVFAQHKNVVDENFRPKVNTNIFASSNVDDEIFYNILPNFQTVARNLPEIEKVANGLGHFSLYNSQDTIARKIPLFLYYNDLAPFPALIIEMLRLGGNFKNDAYGIYLDNTKTVAEKVLVKPFVIPVDADASLWVHYSNYSPEKTYISAADILNNSVKNSDRLKGAYVIVGASAAGLFDIRSTPLASRVPGVEVHLQALETVLNEDYLYRFLWFSGAEKLFILFSGILLIYLLTKTSAIASGLVAFAFIAIINLGCFYLYKTEGYLIDGVYPSLVLFVLFSALTLLRYMKEENSRKAIKLAFSHYLSPEMVEILSKSPEKLHLGGMEKNMSILFADIRSFTSISEKLSPEQLSYLLNRYLTPMTDIVQKNEGTIDKYIGDALMAFWNAPLDVENHEQKACEAALMMQRRLAELNTSLRKEGLPELKVGIGINSGVMNVGNMGSKQRFDYTVMGDAVNLASRLEGLSKFYGVNIIVSENVKNIVKDGIFMLLDKVSVKGKTKSVAIYALLGMRSKNKMLANEGVLLQLEKSANQLFQFYINKNWNEAEIVLKEFKQFPKFQEVYDQRIKKFKQTPPPLDWDGVFRADFK